MIARCLGYDRTFKMNRSMGKTKMLGALVGDIIGPVKILHSLIIAGAIAACMYPIPDYIAERCNNILTDDLSDIKDRFLEIIEDK